MSVACLKSFSRGSSGAGGSVVSFGDSGKEILGIGAGRDNGTVCRRGIDYDAVTELCGEKYGTDSKNVISANIKYFLL